MNFKDIFIGINIALVIQMLISVVLCWSQKKQKLYFLGIFSIVFIHNALRGSVLKPLVEDIGFFELILPITSSQFFTPILFLYLISHIKVLSNREIFTYLLPPLILLAISITSPIFWEYLNPNFRSYFIQVYDGMIMIIIFVYTILGINLVQNHNRWVLIDPKYRNRISIFFILLSSYFLFNGIWNFVKLFTHHSVFDFYYPIQLTFFYILFVLLPLYNLSSIQNLKKFFVPNTLILESPNEAFIKKELHAIFNIDKAHLNPGFSSSTLYNRILVEQIEIRNYFKRELKSTVPDYITKQRIQAFKEVLQANEKKNYDLFGIAMECGFNSRSTFYRAFKKFELKTPAMYIKEIGIQ